MKISKLTFLAISFGLVLTIVLFFTIQLQVDNSLTKEYIDQKAYLNFVALRLEKFKSSAEQISLTLQKNLNYQKHSKDKIEQLLISHLESGSKEFIYGIGIWFEPYQFDARQKLFGPYAHRDLTNLENTILTYEWNTEKYNYVLQNWYLIGLSAINEPVFIQPYLDNGQIYFSLTRVFLNRSKKIQGIISVDLILPQLKNILGISDLNKETQAYILNNERKIIEHSHADNVEVLNKSLEEFQKEKNIFSKKKIRSELELKELGWIIGIEKSNTAVYSSINKLKKISYLIILSIWFIIILIILKLNKYEKNKIELETTLNENKMRMLISSKLASLGEMSSAISHEINNPLTIIIAKVELLKKINFETTQNQQKLAKDLETILKMSYRIAHIVKGLKIYARDATHDPFEPIDIQEIIENTISFCQELINIKNIKLITDIPEAILFDGRESEISQVLLNLLNNSIDAILELEDKWIKIEVLSINETYFKIIFTDSGKGIPNELVDKIMQPFFTTKEVGKGTGLGLSISSSLILGHKGSLNYVKDAPNTQFEIILPFIQKNSPSTSNFN